jgi:hypothetical protein
MRPKPTRPSVLPRSSIPAKAFFSQRPSFIVRSAAGVWRASDSISAIASSATLTLFAPGALMTSTPRAVAASTSIVSTPVPARATMRSAGAASSRSAVTLVALRTTSASAAARALSSASRGRPAVTATSHPRAASGARDAAGMSSATTIFTRRSYSVGAVSSAAIDLRKPWIFLT